MLAKRVIPCLDVDRGRVVKGTNFVNLRDAGDPVEVAARYEAEGADELVFLDITASHEGREIMLDVVRRTAEVIFMPLCRGGRHSHARRHSRLAAGRLRQGVDQYGRRAQSASSSRQAARGSAASASWSISTPSGCMQDGREVWEVHTHGGRVRHRSGGGGLGSRGRAAGGRRNRAHQHGCRRHEKRLRFGDHPGGERGGVGFRWWPAAGRASPEHLADAILLGKADAALAASIFHFGEYTIHETKRVMHERGIAGSV